MTVLPPMNHRYTIDLAICQDHLPTEFRQETFNDLARSPHNFYLLSSYTFSLHYANQSSLCYGAYLGHILLHFSQNDCYLGRQS